MQKIPLLTGTAKHWLRLVIESHWKYQSTLLRLKKPALDFLVFNFGGGMVVHHVRKKMGDRLSRDFCSYDFY